MENEKRKKFKNAHPKSVAVLCSSKYTVISKQKKKKIKEQREGLRFVFSF